MKINLRIPSVAEQDEFLKSVANSKTLHYPWVTAPNNKAAYQDYLQRIQQENQKGYFIYTEDNHLAGVFNLSEIVRGCFQSAYLGFYSFAGFSGQGYMSAGLKLVLHEIFTKLHLHRIEANIQPHNLNSLHLVKANNFKREGFSPRYLKINDVWCDHERWALTYEDWIEFKKISSNRIELIPIDMKYAGDCCQNFTKEVTRYMWPSAPKTQEEINQHILLKQSQMREGKEISSFILKKDTEEFLGYVSIHQANTTTPELGIWLKKEAHGHQYGYEALSLLKAWAEHHLQYDYLKYPVDKANIPSRKLAEKLGGQIKDAYIKKSESGNILDEIEYRIYHPMHKK